MRRTLLLLPLCLVVASLTGCGQKGPLVMPARPAAASSTIAPATSTMAPAMPDDLPVPPSQTQY